MKRTTGKVLGLLLTLVMLVSLLPTVALAANETPDPVAEITTEKGTETVVGNGEIQGAIQLAAYKETAEKVKVNVKSGDLDIWGIPCGVTITNSGTGTVAINGKIGVTIPTNETVTLAHVRGWKVSQPATCEREGVQDYYKCRACNKLFEDEEMTIEIENLWDWSHDPAHVLPMKHPTEVVSEPATCTKTGVKDYYHCIYCNKDFEDEACTKEITNLDAWKAENVLPVVPHTPDEHGWYSDEIGHYHVCADCGEFFDELDHEYEIVIDKEPTTTTEGAGHQHCTVCGYDGEAVVLPVHTHEAVLVPGKDATTTTTGLKPYYFCEGCNKNFEDEACTKEITDLDAWRVIPVQTSDAPATGDSTSVTLYVGLMVVAVMSLGAVAVYKRKDTRA